MISYFNKIQINVVTVLRSVAFLFGLLLPQPQVGAAAGTANPVAGPRLTVASECVDLGEIRPTPEKTVFTGIFKLSNTGNEPLKFGHIRTSCGCTNARVVKQELQPGESTELLADLNIAGRFGRLRYSVYVSSNAPGAAQRLTLEATVPDNRTGLVLQPALMVLQPSGNRAFIVNNFTEAPAEITGVELPEGYTLKEAMPAIAPAKGRLRLTINATENGSPEQGRERQSFKVIVSGHEELSGMIMTTAPPATVRSRIADSAKTEPITADSALSKITAVDGALLLHLSKSLRRINDLQFVDVRSAAEFAAGHVPGSQSFPQEKWHEVQNKWPRQAILVVLAADEVASLRAATIFARWGYREIFRLQGGLGQWPGELVPGMAETEMIADGRKGESK